MLTLFAQARKHDADAAAAAGMSFLMIFVIVFLVAMAIGIAIAVFYCLTLSKALHEVRPENRDMEPGQVWLVLIPLFNLYWNFKIASDVPASLRREFRDRGMGSRGDDFGANIGKWYAICNLCCLVPIVNNIAGLAVLVLWIMLWVRIAGYGKQLAPGRRRLRGRSAAQQEEKAAGRRRRL